MLRMLENACDDLKPDLIVFTGDNILGNHLRDYRFSSKKKDMSKAEEFELMKETAQKNSFINMVDFIITVLYALAMQGKTYEISLKEFSYFFFIPSILL